MRYVLVALIAGAIVVGAGLTVLEKPVEEDWRTDLLDLQPFSAVEAPSGDVDRPASKKKKRKRRRGKNSNSTDKKHVTAPSGTSSPPPAAPPPPAGTPSPAEVHYQMGLAYLQQKKIPPAINELKKCIALNPRHALAYRALGMAHSVMGKQSSAVEAFEKFVKLAPKHRDAAKVQAIIDAHRAGK